jgi:hypothetical protein
MKAGGSTGMVQDQVPEEGQRDQSETASKCGQPAHLPITLDPLREEGRDALEPANIPGLSRVVLREIHVAWDNLNCETTVCTAVDIFESRAETGSANFIPHTGFISQAAFDFYFADSPNPRPVKIKLPCQLEVAQESDTEIVHRWAAVRHFKPCVQTPEVRR